MPEDKFHEFHWVKSWSTFFSVATKASLLAEMDLIAQIWWGVLQVLSCSPSCSPDADKHSFWNAVPQAWRIFQFFLPVVRFDFHNSLYRGSKTETDDFRLECDSAIQFFEWACSDWERDLGGSSDKMF